jgi:DNA end-binding protein Ku
MAARSVWKGYIKLSFVTVPVAAYSGSDSDRGKITLNQIHKECGARVKYQKVCPNHGELKADEIVSGFEVEEGRYVTIDPEEIGKLRSKNEKTITIESFIANDAIEPRYYSGRMMYLVPETIGKRPYMMLHQIMSQEKKVGFATGVFNNKQQIMVLRPVGKLIAATFLSYQSEVRTPAEFEPQVADVTVDQKELDLARLLVNKLAAEQFNFGAYKDRYNEELEKLVEAKVAGKQIVAAPAENEPQVINLMEALQKSVDAAKASAKPAKLAAPGTADRRAASAEAPKRKRKSS